MTALHLDIQNDATTAYFNVSPLYRKKAIVQAVQVDTITSLRVEAIHTSKPELKEIMPGEWIVETEDGKHSVSDDKFVTRYEETEGGFRGKGIFRAFQNPLGQKISVVTSWGGIEQGTELCFLIAVCDDNLEASGERHLIEYDEFILEYERISEDEELLE